MKGISRPTELPNLPGYVFYDVTKIKHHKPQTLRFSNGFRQVIVGFKKGIGGEPLRDSFSITARDFEEIYRLDPSIFYGILKRPHAKKFIPQFVQLDKKVLRFFAYFITQTGEHYDMKELHRNVIISYYLSDDTISVIEPHVDNSGLYQGKILSRQKIKHCNGCGLYTWRDFNLDIDIIFYGVKYKICDCDQWTKDFLLSQGVELNKSIPFKFPKTDLIPHKDTKKYPPKKLWKCDRYSLEESKILRFYCIWDDRESLYGEILFYILHYYFIDCTIEIKEVHMKNDGRDPTTLLLKRCRLPKSKRKLAKEQEEENFYTENDLNIGRTIDVFGRKFLLYDCDKFTKEYLRKKYDISDFPDVELPVEIPENFPKGILIQEKEINTLMTLTPYVEKRKETKLINETYKSLRFEAMLDNSRYNIEDKKMVLYYYLADATVKITECDEELFHSCGSRYLKRCPIYKSKTQLSEKDYFQPEDFIPGKKIEINGRHFTITGADLRVLKYYKDRPDLSQEFINLWEDFFKKKGLQTDFNTSTEIKDRKEEIKVKTEYMDKYRQ